MQLGALSLEFDLVDQPDFKFPVSAKTKPSDNEAAVKISNEALAKDKLEELREQVEELRLSDPLAYEKLIEGEIGDGGGV